MKIGITERGDASLDLSWYEQLKNNKVDGAILITKNITPTFISKVMDLYNNGFTEIIVHCTCTGWGGTELEPNVPTYKEQLKNLANLINCGFPSTNCVLRVDPIIPTDEGIEKALTVINRAKEIGFLPKMRLRISVYDEYKHVKQRLISIDKKPFYGNELFFAPQTMMRALCKALASTDLLFECCAEPNLINLNSNIFIQKGCISTTDLDIMNISYDDAMTINPQNRYGCHCLSCKTELLNNRKQCPHKCVYCYWKNN